MIHKTAIIDPKAKISNNVKIGSYSVIGPNVEIGEDTEIKSHVSIVGITKIGKNNKQNWKPPGHQFQITFPSRIFKLNFETR